MHHMDDNDPFYTLSLGLFIGASVIVIAFACIPIVGPFLTFIQTLKEGGSRKIKWFGEEKQVSAAAVACLRFISSSVAQGWVAWLLFSPHPA